jgi:hypothetical protein
MYAVYFENGVKSIVDSVDSEEAAIHIALVGISRSAGLCENHMVRAVKIEKVK